MTQEDATLPGNTEGPAGPAAPARFDVAIGAARELAMALRSAITDVHFAEAVRLHGELGHALSRAADLAGLADPAEREAAVQQLVALREAVARLFETAPSAAAIAAAIAGDRTTLDREEQAWIAERLASGTNPRIPRPRRARTDTRPDSPRARTAKRDDATQESARADVVEPPPAGEDGPR